MKTRHITTIRNSSLSVIIFKEALFMNRMILTAVAFVFLASCSGGVRYSPYEISEFQPQVQEHIKNSEISPGMSQAAVRLAWGPPAAVRVPEPDFKGRYREEWIYTKFRIVATRLIFTDGELTAVLHGMAKKRPLFKKNDDAE
jgi:hypothetical protein